MNILGTFGSVPQNRLPCPSDFDPFPSDDGCEVTEWDLADHIDAAITALQTAQQLEAEVRSKHPSEWADEFERIQKLLNVAREALGEAPL
jgi:hypothetical protein